MLCELTYFFVLKLHSRINVEPPQAESRFWSKYQFIQARIGRKVEEVRRWIRCRECRKLQIIKKIYQIVTEVFEWRWAFSLASVRVAQDSLQIACRKEHSSKAEANSFLT